LVRSALKFRGPQNYLESNRIGFLDNQSANFELKGNFGNHSDILKKRKFANYETLAIHSDPRDVLISQYYYRMGGVLPGSCQKFIPWYEDNKTNILENYRIAPVNGKQACDVIFDYSELDTVIPNSDLLPPDFATLFSTLRLKGQYRDKNSLDTDAYFRQAGLGPNEPLRILDGII